jgi:hypothetical protein
VKAPTVNQNCYNVLYRTPTRTTQTATISAPILFLITDLIDMRS